MKRKGIEGSRGKATKAEVDCQEKSGEEKVKEMEEEARRVMEMRESVEPMKKVKPKNFMGLDLVCLVGNRVRITSV